MNSQIKVLKFGSSVLRTEADLPRVVHDIYARWRLGSQVLVVVSAFGNTTDDLLRRATDISDAPHAHSLAALLATGEATSAAFLGMALHRAGIPVKVLSPQQAGIRTDGDVLDAEPVAADTLRLREHLQSSVVVVSGFAGIDAHGNPTLLGRGGSDLTALFLAERLDAECILVKDVDGLYDSDPNADHGFPARRFTTANYETALDVGERLVQAKAIAHAKNHGINFSITAPGSRHSTRVHDGEEELADETIETRRLRVALFGCGTVGGGVFKSLSALPDHFEIVGVADRNAGKATAARVPEHLFTPNPGELLAKDCDVVIELFGGVNSTRDIVIESLDLRRHVVTANKALLADEIDLLESTAVDRGVELRYSAAVGGVMPALETVYRSAYIRGFSGIINGTCNFICDALAAGSSFDDAVHAAQIAGFAEADPTLDVNGTDAAQKLILLARAAFGEDLNLADITRVGVDAIDCASIREAAANGKVVKVVASCHRTDNGIVASVSPVAVDASHPFALARGADNCLLIEFDDGSTQFIRGKGAGRWPTVEAVIADLLDLRRELGNLSNTLSQPSITFSSTEVYA